MVYKVLMIAKPPIEDPAQPVIETDRLRLKPWQMADLPFLHAILGDLDVMAFSDRGVLSPEDQVAWLQQTQLRKKPEQGLGTLAIERKQDAQIIGYISLVSDLERVAEGEAEIGFRLAKHAWRQGYATEALTAIIQAASQASDILRIVAIVDPGNRRSIQVLKKAGMTYGRDIFFAGYDHADHLYVLATGR